MYYSDQRYNIYLTLKIKLNKEIREESKIIQQFLYSLKNQRNKEHFYFNQYEL